MARAFQMLQLRKAAAAGLDTQTVTTGADGTTVSLDRRRGFESGTIGAIADGTSNLYAGAAITAFLWDEGGGSPSYMLTITGAANSGWTSVTIGGTKVLTRASASFFLGTWTWTTTDTAASQAFGIAGANKSCVFN